MVEMLKIGDAAAGGRGVEHDKVKNETQEAKHNINYKCVCGVAWFFSRDFPPYVFNNNEKKINETRVMRFSCIIEFFVFDSPLDVF